jgi:cyclic pyranopterin phosphate synthase
MLPGMFFAGPTQALWRILMSNHAGSVTGGQTALIDRFGRHVTYLRVSVTDRCDLRCVYCMSENMKFLPRASLLSLEEVVRIGRAFVELGVTKIRITGGEPLHRRNILKV